jgi:branched-chain amino acid transport system substrate-binding protein
MYSQKWRIKQTKKQTKKVGPKNEPGRKQMKRIFALLAGVLMLGLWLGTAPAFAKPDCGENTGKKATGKPIPIGAVTSMSGIGSFKEADEAAKAYFDCVNDNGGIHGRPIVYHDEDDQSQLDVAAQAAKKLVGDEGVYVLIGSTSFIECIPNANYYLKENVLEIGLGIPSQCYQSKNIAEINAGPRQSGIGGADYARRKLGAKSLVCSIPKFPGSDYSCNGLEEWGKKYGVKVNSIYSDPVSPDYNSLVLQFLATGDEAIMVYGTDDTGARILDAAEQQDGAAKMKWTVPTSYYTVRIPKAIDAKYWNDRLWVNAELAPLDSKGKDNQNWAAVMDAYGGKSLRDSFSQAGYIAGRIAVNAMLSIKNPDDVNRNTVTAAIQNMKPYDTDILCMPWYWGGPEATEHNANHVTRTVTIHDGKWKTVEGCMPDLDPGLANIEAMEKKLGIAIKDQVPPE